MPDEGNLKYTNRSMDFLEMIKNNPEKKTPNTNKSTTPAAKTAGAVSANATIKKKVVAASSEIAKKKQTTPDNENKLRRTISKNKPEGVFAVIDTETNWYNEVMSIGIALGDVKTFKCVGAKYYIIDPEYRKGGMYSDVMNVVKSIPSEVMSREDALSSMVSWLGDNKVTQLYAYNAKFDKGHLEELGDFEWFDIMRLAAYKQYNSCIPADAECCKTGRLKRGYAVEDILKMLSGDFSYSEVHNAVMDAIDELKIMELLGHTLDVYACGKL